MVSIKLSASFAGAAFFLLFLSDKEGKFHYNFRSKVNKLRLYLVSYVFFFIVGIGKTDGFMTSLY